MKNTDIKNLKDKEPFGQELIESVVSNLNLQNVDMDSVEKIILSIFKNSNPDRSFQNLDFDDINLKSDSSTSVAKESQPPQKKEQIFSFTKIPKEKKKEMELMKKNTQQQNTAQNTKTNITNTNTNTNINSNINSNLYSNNTIPNLNNYYNHFQYKPTSYLNGNQKMPNGYGSYLQNYYSNYNYLNEYSDPNGYNKNAQIEHFINSCLDSSNPEDLTKLLMYFSGDTMNSTLNATLNSNLYQNPYFFQHHQQQNKEKEMYNTLKRYVSESYSNNNKTVNPNSTTVNNVNNLSNNIKTNNNEEKEKNNQHPSQEVKEQPSQAKPDDKTNNQTENNNTHQNQHSQLQSHITSNNSTNTNNVNPANNYIVNLINDSSPQKQKQVEYLYPPQQTQIPNNLYPPFYNFANYQNYAQLAKSPLYTQFMMNPTQNSTLYQVYNNN